MPASEAAGTVQRFQYVGLYFLCFLGCLLGPYFLLDLHVIKEGSFKSPIFFLFLGSIYF